MRKIEINGKEITMREPKVRDMKAVSHITNDMDRELNLIANLTALSVDELEDMNLKDYNTLQKEFSDFLS